MRSWFKLYILTMLVVLGPQVGKAQQDEASSEVPVKEHSALEYTLNFSTVYVTQWAVYLVTQEDTIRDHGSWDNFTHYPFHPGFDKDSFDYNLFKHAWSGQYYYLFYRYRGYSETEAFTWTFLSSLAFEFAVETYTEKPSIQDIYQTPIYGTLVGMGFERLSAYFRSSESVFVRALGVVLNPFTLLPQYDLAATPVIKDETVGVAVSWRY